MPLSNRTLDYQGFISAQDPRTYPTRDIRNLEAQGGSQQAIIQQGDQQADDFTSILNILRQYQQFGQQQGNQAQQEQIDRVFQTPSNLIGASPQLQGSVRQASVGAVQPTISGARSLVEEARGLLTEYQQTQEKQQNRAQDIIDKATATGSAGLEELMRVQPDIFKQAGTNVKSYEAVLKGIKTQESSTKQQQEFQNRLSSQREGRLGTGITPTGLPAKRLTTSQANEVSDIDALLLQVNELIGSNVRGAVGFLRGPVESAALRIFGKGNARDAQVRALIGNIKGTVAKLRGGTSFTVNEEKLLASYVPNINESTESVLAKAAGLKAYLESKKGAITGQQQNVQETRVVNGVTYIKQEDGLWHKQ